MLQEIKLVVTESSKEIGIVIKKTSTQPFQLVKSLEEFHRDANAALTKMIESQGESGDNMEIQDGEESDDDDEDSIPASPKKRKK